MPLKGLVGLSGSTSQSSGGGGSYGLRTRQGSDLTPYLPTPDQVDEQLHVREAQDQTPSAWDIFDLPSKLFGAYSIRSAIKGGIEDGLSGALKGAATGYAWLTDALGVTDHAFTATHFSDIRQALGNQAPTGWGDAILNFAGDLLTDPTTFLVPFAKIGTAAKTGVASASLEQAVNLGERAAVVLKFPGFSPVPLVTNFGIQSFDMNLARGLDTMAGWLRTNPFTGKILRGFSTRMPGIADPEEAAAAVNSRDAMLDTRNKVHNGLVSLLTETMSPEAQKAVLNDKPMQRVLMMMRELGITGFDDSVSIRTQLANPKPIMQQIALKKALADDKVFAGLWEKATQHFDIESFDKLYHDYEHPLPQELLDVFDASPRNGIDINAQDHVKPAQGEILKDAEMVGLSPRTPQEKARGAIQAMVDKTNPEVAASRSARAGVLRDFRSIMQDSKTHPEKLQYMQEYLNFGQMAMMHLADGEIAGGILNSAFEFYVHRAINPEAKSLINDRFNKWLGEMGGDALNVSASFMKGRTFDQLTTLEVNAMMYQIGSKVTGYIPLKDIQKFGYLDSMTQKIFGGGFARRIAKVDPGASQFFLTNPLAADFARIEQSASVQADRQFWATVFHDDSPLHRGSAPLSDPNALSTLTEEARQQNGVLMLYDKGKARKMDMATAEQILAETEYKSRYMRQTDVVRRDTNRLLGEQKLGYEDARDRIKDSLHVGMMPVDTERVVKSAETPVEKYLSGSGKAPVESVSGKRWVVDPNADLTVRATDTEAAVMLKRAFQEERDAKATYAAARHEMRLQRSAWGDGSRTPLGQGGSAAGVGEYDSALNQIEKQRAVVENARAGVRRAIASGDENAIAKARQAVMDERQALQEAKDALPAAREKLRAYGADLNASGDVERSRYLAQYEREVEGAAAKIDRSRASMDATHEAIQGELDDLKRISEVSSGAVTDAAGRQQALISAAKSRGLNSQQMAEAVRMRRTFEENGLVAWNELTPEQQAKITTGSPDARVFHMDPETASGLIDYYKDQHATDFMKKVPGMQTLARMTGVWSSWTVTNPLFPNSRVRDYITGMATQLMGGGNPFAGSVDANKVVSAWTNQLNGGKSAMEALANEVITLADGTTLPLTSVLQKAQQYGFVNSGMVRDIIQKSLQDNVDLLGPVSMKKIATTFFKIDPKENELLRAGYKWAGYLDDQVKLSGFIDRLKAGFDESAAVDFVRKWTYDPQRTATSIERFAAKPFIPFVSFLKWSIGRTAEQLVTNPASVTWIDKVRNVMSETPPGGGEPIDPAKMETILPDFIKEGMGIPYQNGPDGPRYFLLGGYLPAAEVGKLSNAIRTLWSHKEQDKGGLARYFLGNVNPFIKETIAQVVNQDAFTNRDIDQYPGQTGEMFGVTMPKRAIHLLRNVRMLSELDKLNVLNLAEGKAAIDAVERGQTDGSRHELPFFDRFIGSAFGVSPKTYNVDPVEAVRTARRVNERYSNDLKGKLRFALTNIDRNGNVDNVDAVQKELANSLAEAKQIEAIGSDYGVPKKLEQKKRVSMQLVQDAQARAVR